MVKKSLSTSAAKTKKKTKKAAKKKVAAKKSPSSKTGKTASAKKAAVEKSSSKTASPPKKQTTKSVSKPKKTKLAVKSNTALESKRMTLIQQTAYYIAEKRGFVGGDPEQDWLLAEKQVDKMLKQS